MRKGSISYWGCVTKTSIMIIGIVSACGVSAGSDYLSDRKAALALAGGGTNEAALSMFVRMAANTSSDAQKSDALEQAAMLAHTLKQDDRAMALARQIPLAPLSKTVQMRFMNDAHKLGEIVDAFKGENIAAWPESIAVEAYHLRGKAYIQTKDGKADAVADLQKAIQLTFRPEILTALANTCVSLLKDDDLGLEAYRRALQFDRMYSGCIAAAGAAGILARQGKFDEARMELEKINLDEVANQPAYSARVLAAYGDILVKQGKKAEAIAKYREAAGLKDLDASQKAAYEKAIKDLAP